MSVEVQKPFGNFTHTFEHTWEYLLSVEARTDGIFRSAELVDEVIKRKEIPYINDRLSHLLSQRIFALEIATKGETEESTYLRKLLDCSTLIRTGKTEKELAARDLVLIIKALREVS